MTNAAKTEYELVSYDRKTQGGQGTFATVAAARKAAITERLWSYEIQLCQDGWYVKTVYESLGRQKAEI